MFDTHLDREHTRGWVNAQSYAEGDGETDDGASLADAALAAAGRELFVPDGTYVVSGKNGPIVIPDGTVVRFAGKNAKIDYRGAGAAFEVRNSRNIAFYDPFVDLTNAGPNAIGVWLRGAWFVQIHKPKIAVNAAGQAGIQIDTSQTGGDEFGSYLIEIHNPQIFQIGLVNGLYGIRTVQTPGDTYSITHLNVYGGWSKGVDYGLFLRNVSGFQIRGWVADTGIDGINIGGSSDGLLIPGELGGAGGNALTGYGIRWVAGCSAMTLVAPNKTTGGGTLGYQDNSLYTPQTLDQGKLRLYASRSDQTYYLDLSSLFVYGQSLALKAKGGGGEGLVLGWGDAAGTTLGDGARPVNLAGPTSVSVSFAPPTDAGAVQTGRVFMGSGVPNNANGSNGDVYHRTDTPAVANQRLYVKSAGAWVGIL